MKNYLNILEGIPEHRITWLRQQGEAYYADGLRNINENRRLAILAVCALEWKAMVNEPVLETHDRIVGKIYNDAKRIRDDQLSNQRRKFGKQQFYSQFLIFYAPVIYGFVIYDSTINPPNSKLTLLGVLPHDPI